MSRNRGASLRQTGAQFGLLTAFVVMATLVTAACGPEGLQEPLNESSQFPDEPLSQGPEDRQAHPDFFGPPAPLTPLPLETAAIVLENHVLMAGTERTITVIGGAFQPGDVIFGELVDYQMRNEAIPVFEVNANDWGAFLVRARLDLSQSVSFDAGVHTLLVRDNSGNLVSTPVVIEPAK